MFWSQQVAFDVLRSKGFASITGSYSAVGSPTAHVVRLMCITNTTDGDMLFSDDGVNDKLILPASSYKLFDLTTNKGGTDGFLALQSGIQFYVKELTAPSKGSVYIELIYGKGE